MRTLTMEQKRFAIKCAGENFIKAVETVNNFELVYGKYRRKQRIAISEFATKLVQAWDMSTMQDDIPDEIINAFFERKEEANG